MNNIFYSGELSESTVCAKFAHTTQHVAVKGKTQEAKAKLYSLDMIISVRYGLALSKRLSYSFPKNNS